MLASIVSVILHAALERFRDERGLAIAWVALGIVLGIVLIVVGIIKFLIPGE